MTVPQPAITTFISKLIQTHWVRFIYLTSTRCVQIFPANCQLFTAGSVAENVMNYLYETDPMFLCLLFRHLHMCNWHRQWHSFPGPLNTTRIGYSQRLHGQMHRYFWITQRERSMKLSIEAIVQLVQRRAVRKESERRNTGLHIYFAFHTKNFRMLIVFSSGSSTWFPLAQYI